jgi:hypothetical protein
MLVVGLFNVIFAFPEPFSVVPNKIWPAGKPKPLTG